jgi:hypothetical protein
MYSGSAVGLSDNANVTVDNCTFVNLQGNAFGGAIWIHTNSTAYIKNSIFLNNTANTGGVLYIQNSGNVTLENNLFADNTAIPIGLSFLTLNS